MSDPKQLLLNELCQRGIVDEPTANRLMQHTHAPWYVALLSGLAAWLAALLLIGSTLYTIIDESALAAAITGSVLLGMAVWLLRKPGVFVSQLGLALSMVGQGVLLVAVSHWDIAGRHSEWPVAMAAALVAGIMWLVPAVMLHRQACALIAIGAGAVFIGFSSWLTLYGLALAVVAAWLWLRRGDWAGSRRADLWRSLAGAATLAALAWPIIGNQRWGSSVAELMGDAAAPLLKWLYPAGAGVLLIVTGFILARAQQPTIRLGVALATLLLIALGVQAPGLLIATALWLAVFHACERFWSVLVGIGATLYLADLYYSLHITLLEKSVLLVASGALLLVLRWFLLRRWRDARAS
ncbi:MAG: DUF4401 domain-containing protein [Pseudomonas sp.]